jgi:hypothetical protein
MSSATSRLSAAAVLRCGCSGLRSIDAWVLIVEDAGQLRIGHVNFEFMD